MNKDIEYQQKLLREQLDTVDSELKELQQNVDDIENSIHIITKILHYIDVI